MKFPALFLNHGGGPLPLMGAQPNITKHLQDAVFRYVPTKPKAIVVVSAHYESDPISITASKNPSMLFDYYGFPQETYQYEYPAPGNPALAKEIHELLANQGLQSRLDTERGYDHGVFVPLMTMYPDATIPVVCVSLHSSLSPDVHLQMGQALAPLRDRGVLLLGSGYTFHNMKALLGRDSKQQSLLKSKQFNDWLKDTMLGKDKKTYAEALSALSQWETSAPQARFAHPREEHLLPLLVVAGSAVGDDDNAEPKVRLIYDQDPSTSGEHAVSSYAFS